MSTIKRLVDMLPQNMAKSAARAERDRLAACRCGGVGYTRRPKSGAFAAVEVCVCMTSCKVCRGRRSVVQKGADGLDEVKHCPECGAVHYRARAFNNAELPHEFAWKTLTPSAPGDRNGYTDRGIESLRRAKQAVSRYMNGPGERGLVLFGGVGAGKTHLVCALLSYLALEVGVDVRFVDYGDLLARVKATFDAEDVRTADIIASYVDAPLLCIDDLGKGQATEWVQSVIDEVISKRYNAGRPVIATTNYVTDGMAAARLGRYAMATLEDRIGERVVSRLRGACDWLVLEADDFRGRA